MTEKFFGLGFLAQAFPLPGLNKRSFLKMHARAHFLKIPLEGVAEAADSSLCVQPLSHPSYSKAMPSQ